MLKKRQNRAPEAGSVLPRGPNVLRIPARDGGGEIWFFLRFTVLLERTIPLQGVDGPLTRTKTGAR